MSNNLFQYRLVTANYWAFTLTDGALRMLVVLYFYSLGYDALAIAFLFLFYEFFGVVTNLVGGFFGAKFGLNKIMHVGLCLQIIALGMLLVPSQWLSIAWVMAAQALSGVAKDLNKMSAKSAVKLLVSEQAHHQLFRWVAVLTGSKNTLKGIGFFLGAVLLTWLGFWAAIASMAVALCAIWLISLMVLTNDLGRTKQQPKFKQLLAKTAKINWLSAARLLLFASRDTWFVVALPVFLSQQMQWDHWQVGAVLAIWIIGYGLVQAAAPWLLTIISGRSTRSSSSSHTFAPNSKNALVWLLALAFIPALIAISLWIMSEWSVFSLVILLVGLGIFGVVFAINSSLHSFLIVSYAKREHTALDVGFYYMANAAGRLFGTLLSGTIYVYGGLIWCLLTATILLLVASICSWQLTKIDRVGIAA